jgi:hypothetical protein
MQRRRELSVRALDLVGLGVARDAERGVQIARARRRVVRARLGAARATE